MKREFPGQDISSGKLQRVEFSGNKIEILLEHPEVYMIADEFAAVLDEANVENYLEFDMMPNPNNATRPIRVTIQWADGISPAQRAYKIENSYRTELGIACEDCGGTNGWICDCQFER